MLSIKHVTVSMIVLFLHVWVLDLLCPSVAENARIGNSSVNLLEVFFEDSEELDEDPGFCWSRDVGFCCGNLSCCRSAGCDHC